jgi:hypothetical protein
MAAARERPMNPQPIQDRLCHKQSRAAPVNAFHRVREGSNNGGSGVAFFAHVGGFVFGVIAARVLIAIGPSAVDDGVAVQRG